jgi:hypothetical protein
MRGAIFVLVLFVGTALTAQSVSDTIIQRERAKLRAEQKGDGIRDFYLPTYAGVNQRGLLQTVLPGSVFQTIGDPKFVLEEPLKVQVHESVAIVTGIQAPGGSRRARFVRLWVKDGPEWKIAMHQGTLIADSSPTPTSALVSATTAPGLSTLTGEEAAVLKVENALADAYVNRDVEAYERWTAPEFVSVTDTGHVIARGEWVKNHVMEDGDKRRASVRDDVKIRTFGDVAAITARSVTPRLDGTMAPSQRVIRILVKKSGSWQQVLAQSTMIQDPLPPN